jgi:alkylated DNA repair dioxygenase AlkB
MKKNEYFDVLPHGGKAILYRDFISNPPIHFAKLLNSIEWQQGQIQRYGKVMQEGRLTAWYGDPGAIYKYSGKVNEPKRWTPELLNIKTIIENEIATKFNSCLLNYYRDGKDSIGYHADDEKDLDENATIASLSLGGTRKFCFKHKKTREVNSVHLNSGDLLLMFGDTQKNWKHSVPKCKNAEARINLTFRIVKSSTDI